MMKIFKEDSKIGGWTQLGRNPTKYLNLEIRTWMPTVKKIGGQSSI